MVSKPVWTLLTTTGFFLVWLDYPATISTTKKYSLVGVGIALLLLMAILFKGGEAAAPVGMKPYWWGILGIIGWAYLVCALIFLVTKGRLFYLLVALGLFITINIASHGGLLNFKIPVIGDAFFCNRL
jgi:hypothetical protein